MEIFGKKDSIDNVQYSDNTKKNTIGNSFTEGKIDFRQALFNLRFRGNEAEEKMAKNFEKLKELKNKRMVSEIGFTVKEDGSFNFYGVLSDKGKRAISSSETKDKTNKNPGGEQQILTGKNQPLERNIIHEEFLPTLSNITENDEVKMIKEMIAQGLIEEKKFFGNNWYKQRSYMVTESENGYSVEKTTMTKFFN